MNALKRFSSKKIDPSQVNKVKGGISCGDMFQVIAEMYNNNQAQFQTYVGMTLQCTETYYGATVTKYYGVTATGQVYQQWT